MESKTKIIWYSVQVYQDPALQYNKHFDDFESAYNFLCTIDKTKVNKIDLYEHSLVISREFVGV